MEAESLTGWGKGSGSHVTGAPFATRISSFALPVILLVSFALQAPSRVSALAPPGTIYTYVGGGNGDGAQAESAIIDPRGITEVVGVDGVRDLYIADGKNNRVRRVDRATGVIETVAGNGTRGYGGDGGPAENAQLAFPLDVAATRDGVVYIADMSNNRIRKVGRDGKISTVAGNGLFTYGGDGGPAVSASIASPYGVALDAGGNLYIADYNNNRIRKVSSGGIITTVAGNGQWSYGGDGGPATSAALRNPTDVAFDALGNMYIADSGNQRIRRVDTAGRITTVAGAGPGGFAGDGGPATQAWLYLPVQVAVDDTGNIFIADNRNHRVRWVQAATGRIFTLAGTGDLGSDGDGGPAQEADLYPPFGVAVSPAGEVLVSVSTEAAQSQHNRVRRILDLSIIDSLVGGGFGDGGPAVNALVDPRGGEAVSSASGFPDLYFADGNDNRVRRVRGATGVIETLAGNGEPGYSGDNGPAVDAMLKFPLDVAVRSDGVVYVADTFNNRIRKIASNGTITTVAGTGSWNYSGDGGPATSAALAYPYGIDVDANGNVYIADFSNNRIRKIGTKGVITTVAGNGQWGYGGDNGPATSAKLANPADVVVGGDGSLYIADYQNQRIRRVNPSGIITTYAGTGISGFLGDDGPATAARLFRPLQVALDGTGNLFIADSVNNRVRRVDAGSGIIETVAGDGDGGASGDGGAADQASLTGPEGVAIDPNGAELFASAPTDSNVRLVEFDGGGPPATATAVPPSPTPTGTPTAATARLSGQVLYYNGDGAVPNVDVMLNGSSTQVAGTTISGQYAKDLASGSWTVNPQKEGALGAGVSSLDAARVLQAMVGLRTLDPLQRLACDVTGDGSLSSLDAARILQLSVGMIDRFPVAEACSSDWVFVPQPSQVPNQEITEPVIGSGVCRHGSISLDPLVGTATGQDFRAVLFGDCTGNWSSTAGAALRILAPSSAVVHAGRPRRARGGRVRVPIYVQTARPFNALDLQLRYDPAEVRPLSVELRSRTAGALVRHRIDGSGRMYVSLASAKPVQNHRGAVLVAEFRAADPNARSTSVRVVAGSIDEQSARVANPSSRR
jgi:sugar lactone lactonase YvrE